MCIQNKVFLIYSYTCFVLYHRTLLNAYSAIRCKIIRHYRTIPFFPPIITLISSHRNILLMMINKTMSKFKIEFIICPRRKKTDTHYHFSSYCCVVLLDSMRFARPLVQQIRDVPVFKETRVEHVFNIVKIVHSDAVERVDEEHAIFRPVSPRH